MLGPGGEAARTSFGVCVKWSNIENELGDAVVVPQIVAPERSSATLIYVPLLLRADSERDPPQPKIY